MYILVTDYLGSQTVSEKKCVSYEELEKANKIQITKNASQIDNRHKQFKKVYKFHSSRGLLFKGILLPWVLQRSLSMDHISIFTIWEI